jgi:hypothetical protein
MASQLGNLVSGQFQNYFQGNQFNFAGGTGLMESSVTYMQSETASISVRQRLQNRQALLGLTFTGTAGAGDTSARGPAGSNPGTSVYGVGYLIQFQNPTGWAVSDQRVLSNISEIDLGGGTLPVTHAWTCPASMQFIIVQPSDVYPGTGANVVCSMTADPNPATLSASDQQIYYAIRNALPAGSWYLDMTHHCVVPKSQAALTSCYGDRTGLGNIDYSSKSCTPFNQSNQQIGNCAHWVSVCLRQ